MDAYVAIVTKDRQWFEGPFPIGKAVDVAEQHRFAGRNATAVRIDLPPSPMIQDPRDLLIANAIPSLGRALIGQLNGSGIFTLGDLTRIGVMNTDPTFDRPAHWPYWRDYPALLELRGFGPVRINLIRTALKRHGLALYDEEQAAAMPWLNR